MNKKVEVFYEATPNPQAMKFNVAASTDICDESIFFDDPTKTARSPLAQKLFGFPWMKAVYISTNSVTITKQDWVEWSILAEPLSDLLSEHIERGEGVLLPASAFAKNDGNPDDASPESGAAINANDSFVVKKIKEILERDIRPAVAMDGGDIVFSHYENNRLYLHMQGACSGCPSSAMTLKDGIETRMREEIPELIEVIAV